MKLLLPLIICVLGLAQRSPCQELMSSAIPDPSVPNAPWAASPVTVPHCLQSPTIDGKLTDSCWPMAMHAAGFYRFFGTAPVTQQTEAWLCTDKDHVYIAFHCHDDHPEMIKSTEVKRDGDIGNDDYVTVEIDSQNTRHGTSLFQVSARGTQSESIEGGTADNITWAGDWKAATQRVPDGWTTEIAIPFALLHYSRSTHAFGILLKRKLARESSEEGWPYIPHDLQDHTTQYLTEFRGIAPPYYPPRAIFLPYALATGGASSTGRVGMDIKYPLTTTMTGVATLFPDFKTVEQDVTDIDFSYTEKYLSDRRPFFAEGSDYFPYRDVFYSRRIDNLDGGLKLAGKQGDTSIGFLGTTSRADSGRHDAVLDIQKEFGQLSSVMVNYAQDNQTGQPSNRVGKIESILGWQAGRDRYKIQADHLPSWVGDHEMNSKDYLSFGMTPPNGRIGASVATTDIGSTFTSNLGFVPELDSRGEELNLSQQNSFDTGKLNYYEVDAHIDHYDHHTGGFFHRRMSLSAYLEYRNGKSFYFESSRSKRDEFNDHITEAYFSWGGRTLHAHGSIDNFFGKQAGETYHYVEFDQGYAFSRSVFASAQISQLHLGSDVSSQTVLTSNYQLNAVQSFGLRAVNSDNSTNVFLSFAQKVRSGNDLYILIGDPNSPTTRGEITVKIISPRF